MVQFRAMNTDVTVLTPGIHPQKEVELARGVKRVFEAAEDTFSRFRADTELTRLNRASGPCVVSNRLLEALERARTYWELTDGWFDPSIATALVSAGYDRSYAAGALDRDEPAAPTREASSFGDIVIDRTSRTVALPPGTALDCGGFIKGWAVDEAAASFPSLAAVDAGGDACLRGLGPDGLGWLVDVEDPVRPGQVLVSLRLANQSVATSGANRRRWRVGTRQAHHLINPRTGQPVETDLAQVTVVAPSTESADVLAKTAFLRGVGDGVRFLQRFDNVSGALVLLDGSVRFVGGLQVADAA